jgi:membrane protein
MPLADLSQSVSAAETVGTTPAPAEPQPVPAAAVLSKWFVWRAEGKKAIDYLLDSEVHTYAFSVAANAILSFIPFCVLLYKLTLFGFSREGMTDVVNQMVVYYLPHVSPGGPSTQDFLVRNLQAVAHLGGRITVFSLVMILIACTGIFLPLEVALNQAWGVTKSRNYLLNQAVAFGLAILMLVLGMGSVFLNMGFQDFLAVVFFHHTDNFVFHGITYLWLAFSTGIASILFFFAIYWLLPNRKVPWRPVFRTSIVTGIIWLVAKLIFAAVLPHLHLNDMYGPFQLSVGLLFWAYISGLILFAGAQFSVAHWGHGNN